MTWLLRLYPRAWRRRYGAEIAEVISSQPRSLQLAVDLLGGAVDAHMKPQAFARRLDRQPADPSGGIDMVYRLKGCARTAENMTVRESAMVAGLTLGGALLFSALLFLIDDPLKKNILLTMFPGLLVLPAQAMYLRGHSLSAKLALTVGPLIVLFLIGLAAALIAAR